MKKLLIALLVLGLIAPGMAMAQDLEQRVDRLEENMQEFTKQGMKLKETVIGMKKFGFHFYGSLRTHLGYYDVDQEYSGGLKNDGTIGNSWDDDSGTTLSVGSQSRFGAKAIASENFYGVLEFGLEETDRDGQTNDTYLRLAYGVWDFGSGELMVGKNYTPATYLGYSSFIGDVGAGGDANLLVSGLPFVSRQPLIELQFGDFEFALIEPYTEATDYSDSQYIGGLAGGAAVTPNTDVDFKIPRIEVAHVFRLNDNNLRIRPVAGYQTYDVETDTGVDESIDSWLVGLGASADFGPAYVKATVSYFQNPGNYGQVNTVNVAFREATVDGDGDINDADAIQGTLAVGFKANDMVTLEAGGSYQGSEVDSPEFTYPEGTPLAGQTVYADEGEQTGYLYYAQAWISLNENVHIIPEIGIVDRDEVEYSGVPGVGTVKSDLGKMSYFDVCFRMDF